MLKYMNTKNNSVGFKSKDNYHAVDFTYMNYKYKCI